MKTSFIIGLLTGVLLTLSYQNISGYYDRPLKPDTGIERINVK